MPWPDIMTKSVAYTQPIHAYRQASNPILISNILLLGIAGLLLSFYIIQANIIAADKYKIRILNEKLTSLNEAGISLMAQRSEIENPSGLMEFARSRNMVEAKNVTYLFENGNVALKQ